MESASVQYEIDAGIGRIVLNRPDQLNAISPALLEALDRICESIECEPGVRVVTLTGAGRVFCAGADLKAVRGLSADAVKWNGFMRLWHRVFDRIEALPVPVIAGVHGLALAGGLERAEGPAAVGAEARRHLGVFQDVVAVGARQLHGRHQ